MIDYYLSNDIDGIIPLATTGGSPTISKYEYEEILEKTIEYCNLKDRLNNVLLEE